MEDARYMLSQQKKPNRTGKLRLSSKPKKSMACGEEETGQSVGCSTNR